MSARAYHRTRSVRLARTIAEIIIPYQKRTYQAAKGDWRFEALPPVKVKGKAEPLPVYRPVRRTGEREVRVGGALVGRQAEMATLARLLEEAVAGRRRVVLLEREAGIGKSRLVAGLAFIEQRAGRLSNSHENGLG
jgi:hypothetical protein